MMNRKVTLLPLILLAGGALVLAGCDGGGASSTTSVGGTSSTGTSEAPTIDPDPSTPYMDEIVSGETYHLGIYQQTLQKYIWYNGQMSGYYFATVDNYDDGVEVLATAVDGVDNGYTLQVGSAYIAAEASGTHNNIIVSPTAFTWTWNTDGDYFSGMCGDREVYMGNYGTFNTVSLSTMDHLDGEDTNLARLFDREPGPVEIEEDPRNTPLTTITSGTQYHIGLYNEQLYQQLYFTGDLENDYYGATSRDIADAATVVPTTSGDGYTLKIVGGANDGKYIGYTYSTSTNDEGEVSEHNTFVITDDPFVWTVTSEGYITGIAEGRTEVYFMGSNGTYDTISMYPQNELSNTTTYYPVRFYEHETDPQPIPDPEPEPTDPVKTTIGFLAAEEGVDGNTIYEVTGILEDLDHSDKYGNGYLVDPETGDVIQLYGNTTTTTALSFTNGKLSYENPKDAVTTLADINNGDEITVHVQWSKQYHNAYAVTVDHNTPADATYTVTVPSTVEGATSVVANKTTAAYGEEITITVTPEGSYVCTGATIDHLYAKETVAATEGEGTYTITFKATSWNDVTINMTDPSASVSSAEITVDSFPTLGGYGDYDGSFLVGTETINLHADQIMKGNQSGTACIQGNASKNPQSVVYNTTALSTNIKSITIEIAGATPKDNNLGIVTSSTALTDATTAEGIAFGTTTSYTYTTSGTDNYYFAIGCTRQLESGAWYISKITLNF